VLGQSRRPACLPCRFPRRISPLRDGYDNAPPDLRCSDFTLA
jgi:hypothetical protein